MENYKIVATELNTDYAGFDFAVSKVVEYVNGDVERTTHFFNDSKKARDKFMRLIMKESKCIATKTERAGYETSNIREINGMTTDEILDAYGTFDTATGNFITQVLLLKNPTKN